MYTTSPRNAQNARKKLSRSAASTDRFVFSRRVGSETVDGGADSERADCDCKCGTGVCSGVFLRSILEGSLLSCDKRDIESKDPSGPFGCSYRVETLKRSEFPWKFGLQAFCLAVKTEEERPL